MALPLLASVLGAIGTGTAAHHLMTTPRSKVFPENVNTNGLNLDESDLSALSALGYSQKAPGQLSRTPFAASSTTAPGENLSDFSWNGTSTDIGSRPTNYPIEYYLGGANGTSTDIGSFNSLAPTKQTQAQPPAKATVPPPKPTVTVPKQSVTPKPAANTGKNTTEMPSNQDKGNSNGPDKNSLDWLNQLLPYLLAGGIGYYMGK